MSRMKRQKPSGLTLIEIIFSIAILGTVITLAYASALAAWRSAQSANQRTQAQYLVQQAIESVRAYRDTTVATNNFNWTTFVSDTKLKTGFVVQLDRTSATPGGFTLVDSPQTWKAAGQTLSQSDPTDYKITLKAVDEFTYDPSSGLTAGPVSFSASQPDKISAISVVATVTYKDANGVDSNAQSSTIIARRD